MPIKIDLFPEHGHKLVARESAVAMEESDHTGRANGGNEVAIVAVRLYGSSNTREEKLVSI
jgi:hypothetical protein